MPCTMRQRNPLNTPRRKKRYQQKAVSAPKPVRPRSMRHHGLLGLTMVAQHFVVDENWTPSSLTEEFQSMAQLLNSHATYKRLESHSNRARLVLDSKRLKMQCVEGRIKLQNIISGDMAHNVRNCLIKHSDLQRLYHKMPLNQIADNINQRTFSLRKERDCLQYRLGQLESKFKLKLLEKAQLENRIRYENAYVQTEELQSRIINKKIKNVEVRLRAIQIINTTYKKMVQVLLHDEIYYEPILRSLEDDLKDQSDMIRHILYLGTPAIAKFGQLNNEFSLLEEKSRRNLKDALQIVSSLNKSDPVVEFPPKNMRESSGSKDHENYMRHTRSMVKLKMELESIEKVIKDLKFVTLCSHAKEIYPRVKNQLDNNKKLKDKFDCDFQTLRMLQWKTKSTTVFQNILLNNLSEEEINRIEYLRKLNKIIEQEKDFERTTVEYLKDRSDVYVMLRMCLWNLIEILRHVGPNPTVFKVNYPTKSLRLPLLKFSLFLKIAPTPIFYEENIDHIMYLLKRKVYKLMKSYKAHMGFDIQSSKDKYHKEYLATLRVDNNVDAENQQINIDYGTAKSIINIPSRKHIKSQSAKVLDENVKLNN